jgi:predicted dehydrogenase
MVNDRGPLQIGVIGLGKNWQTRYRRALRSLPERYRVRLVCDEVHEVAVREARRLGCRAALGPTQLLESGEVEALLLTDAQWFGLWPLQQACQAGKPVLCAADVLPDPELETLRNQAEERGLPVMVELAPRFAPATADLRQLSEMLGPLRGLTCNFITGGQLATTLLPLLDLCGYLFETSPTSALAAGSPTGTFLSVSAEFPGQRHAQLTGWRAVVPRHSVQLYAIAERGCATLDLPGRVSWTDAEGRHLHTRPGQPPPERALLERFAQALEEGQPPQPNLADACQAMTWLQAVERSCREGRRILLGQEQP